MKNIKQSRQKAQKKCLTVSQKAKQHQPTKGQKAKARCANHMKNLPQQKNKEQTKKQNENLEVPGLFSLVEALLHGNTREELPGLCR